MYQNVWAILVGCAVIAASPGAHAEDPCAEGLLTTAATYKDTLYLRWSGGVRPGMSERINVAFNETKTFTKNVVLIISSCGGETGEMHQTISVLRDIKRTHVLTTAVVRGGNCSSACVPIFLQGSARMAALASVWLLHHAVAEVTDGDTITRRTDAAATERVIKDYFEPAGVSKRWLKKVRAKIKSGDYWQTGRDLWESKSGVFTVQLQNLEKRDDNISIQHFMPTVVCGDFCRG
jgi:hypothetical protein